MYNIKPEVFNILKTDATLTALLGGQRIYFQVAPEPKAQEFPRLTYYEYDNRSDLFADDVEITSEIRIVVDVWSKTSTTDITNRVIDLMERIGFKREEARDLYDNDTKTLHKYLRFLKVVDT